MTIGSLVGTGSELLDVQVEFASPSVVILNAIVILALVFLNGFFVASEFALVKVRSSQLDALEDEGNKRAGFVRHVYLQSRCLSLSYPVGNYAYRAWD